MADYLVLMQRTWRDNPDYLDVEGVIYHYPERYFAFITGFERFIYYRPSDGARSGEKSTYFGYGTLGVPFADPVRTNHRYVPIRQYRRFPSLVPFRAPDGNLYESALGGPTAFTGRSVHRIPPTDFYRILATAGVIGDPYADLPDTAAVLAAGYSPLPQLQFPTQPLREIAAIPEGTGYRPSGAPIDVYEAAALQERARSDHQRTLAALQAMVLQRGGKTLFNNNIDLLAEVRGQRLLIEAKSVNAPSAAVDRMRYGIGQLTDYGVRYRPEIGDASRVLAFGRPPTPESAWIGTILQEASIAFVALQDAPERIVPLNDRARALPLFAAS